MQQICFRSNAPPENNPSQIEKQAFKNLILTGAFDELYEKLELDEAIKINLAKIGYEI